MISWSSLQPFLERIASSLERIAAVEEANAKNNAEHLALRKQEDSLSELMAAEALTLRLLRLTRRPEGGYATRPMSDWESREFARKNIDAQWEYDSEADQLRQRKWEERKRKETEP